MISGQNVIENDNSLGPPNPFHRAGWAQNRCGAKLHVSPETGDVLLFFEQFTFDVCSKGTS